MIIFSRGYLLFFIFSYWWIIMVRPILYRCNIWYSSVKTNGMLKEPKIVPSSLYCLDRMGHWSELCSWAWAMPWIDGFSVLETCFCFGPSNATSESCCILCMSSTLKSQATRWSHWTHADHIVTRLSSKLNWACVFFPQCDMRVKFSLDVSKFESGIGVDATGPSAKDKSS